ncbi:CDP-glycerol glycerophosphotransferase family protein [Spirillospora sp. NPDC048911]|uniref:bifunctional glycosyltransferase/CDP-glycerol:glycerophosphate glycerophosphotransferase n=1 Tax=Spirillospora sp. NPDC048911 TaxID=3364527 RepID=UPI00371904F1
MAPKISVVVPVHDVERHLGECLESLARQTVRDLEVIVVDDGSPDNAAVIAKARAAKDPRFRLVQQRNQGPGGARQAGARLATGDYLAFVDGDDVLAKHAFELLVGSLESTGSDFALGKIQRIDGDQPKPPAVLPDMFADGTAQRTHVSRNPALLGDRTIGNKVFRRSFWEGSGLVFPEGRHENLSVVLPAHVRASKVDLLATTVHYWRARPGDASESSDQPHDLADRLASIRRVCDVLRAHAPALLPDFHRAVLADDLMVLADALPKMEEPEAARLAARAGELLREVGRRTARPLPAFTRLRLHLLQNGMVPELIEVSAPFDRQRLLAAPVVRRGRFRPRWYAAYPYFEDPERPIPGDVYDVTGELAIEGNADSVAWRRGRLVVEGHAYIGRVDLSAAEDTRIRVRLHDTRRNTKVELPVRRVRRPDVTAGSVDAAVCYDWSGFAVEIDPALLRTGGQWRPGEWKLHAEVATQGLKVSGPVGAPTLPQARWVPALEAGDGFVVQPVAGDDHFELRVKRAKAVVTAHRSRAGLLELDGWILKNLGDDASVVASRRDGPEEVRGTVDWEAGPDGGFAFTARLPLDRLVSGRENAVERSRQSIAWDLLLTDGTDRIKLTAGEGFTEARHPGCDREFALSRTKFGSLCGLERPFQPVVTRVEWTADDRLRIAGDDTGPAGRERPSHVLLRHKRSHEEHRVEMSWSGDRFAGFTAELAPGAVPAFGTDVPLAVGGWELLTSIGGEEVPLAIERTALGGLPGPRVVGAVEVSVLTQRTDALRLRLRTALAEDERGPYAQKRLQERDYPRYRSLPLRDLVVFDSYRSRQYSCSPRMIYEELRRQETSLECVWVTKDGRFTAPLGARTVLAGSRDHYEALARARYVVSNEAQPTWFEKRPGQVYVQCWHGTPLKRLGLDVPSLPHMRAATEQWIRQEVPQWDLLVSPSPFASPIMRRAYRYRGEILESGYPRNDLLLSPDRHRIAAEVRGRLGIPAGKRVVLYVPTWRDNHNIAPGRRRFELALDTEEARRVLGDDHVLLLRTHYLVTDRIASQADDFVVDVSAYPDIAELYLIADVLVTDYSSAMFDFAVTRKPMVFYAYDLEVYRDHVRGFYFDFEAEAPGPVSRTSGEVVAALRDIEEVRLGHAEAYEAFVTKFCPHDDGHAAGRVIRRMFELGGT